MHRLEERAALFETRPREIEISEPEVNLADALQRVRLQYPFVPRLPFLQHERIGIQRAGQIALGRERASETLAGTRFATRICDLMKQIAAATVIRKRGGVVALHELDVAGTDEGGGNTRRIVQPFLNRERLAVTRDRVTVLELRIEDRRDAERRAGNAGVVRALPLDRESAPVRGERFRELALKVERIAEILPGLAFAALVTEARGQFDCQLVPALRSRELAADRVTVGASRNRRDERRVDQVRLRREQSLTFGRGRRGHESLSERVARRRFADEPPLGGLPHKREACLHDGMGDGWRCVRAPHRGQCTVARNRETDDDAIPGSGHAADLEAAELVVATVEDELQLRGLRPLG